MSNANSTAPTSIGPGSAKQVAQTSSPGGEREVSPESVIYGSGALDRQQVVTRYDSDAPVDSRWYARTFNYDASWEGKETGYIANEPVGMGYTEHHAICDLLEKLEGLYAPLTVPEETESRDVRDDRARLMSELGLREEDFR